MNALLSIKPKYVEAIVNGKKRYEFRKFIFKNTNIEKVYIYSTAPQKRIVGFFRIGRIIEDHPKKLWSQFQNLSGLNPVEFFSYFEDSEKGFAIEILSLEKYENPIDPLSLMPGFMPPQSFYYVDADMANLLFHQCLTHASMYPHTKE